MPYSYLHIGFVLLLVGTQGVFTLLSVLNVRHADRLLDREREWVETTLGVDDLDEIFPPEGYQLMHTELFPHGIVHVENAQVPEELLNERVQIGTFPWRFRGGESSVSRVVAFKET